MIARILGTAAVLGAVLVLGLLTDGGTSWPPRRNRNRRQP